MLRILLALLALPVLLALAAAPADAASCRTGDGSPRHAVSASGAAGRLVVRSCDRRSGRGRVLARGVERFTAAGPRAAWGLVRGGRARIAVFDRRSGRVARKVDAGPARRRGVDVVLTTAGDLAWLVRRPSRDTELFVQRARGTRRKIRAERPNDLALEDDRTVRWYVGEGFDYLDLRPPPQRDGCAVRGGFVPTLETADMLITTKAYRDQLGSTTVRACLRGSGLDPVVARGESVESYDFSGAVLAARAGWVVVRQTSYSKYSPCESDVLEVVHVDGRAGRRFDSGCRPEPPRPAAGDPVVVTDAGAAAWIKDGRVLAISADGTAAELDRGDVSGLAAAGTSVTWTNAGQPRSAVL